MFELTPMRLSEMAIDTAPPLRMSVLSQAADDKTNRIGWFLSAVVGRTAGRVPSYPAEQYPLRVDSGGISTGFLGTVGMAFGWWLRLRTDPDPCFGETTLARELLPELRPAIEDLLHQLAHPATSPLTAEARARACIVLAWCETVYRIGPMALLDGPLAALRSYPSVDSDILLAAAPGSLADQVLALADVAEAELIPITAQQRLRQPLVLDRRPLRAEGDLQLGSTVLEIKTALGEKDRATGRRRYVLAPGLIRQLVGYALLAEEALGIDSIGVYAARYGLLWTVDVETLLATFCGCSASIGEWREAFATLWADAS